MSAIYLLPKWVPVFIVPFNLGVGFILANSPFLPLSSFPRQPLSTLMLCVLPTQTLFCQHFFLPSCGCHSKFLGFAFTSISKLLFPLLTESYLNLLSKIQRLLTQQRFVWLSVWLLKPTWGEREWLCWTWIPHFPISNWIKFNSDLLFFHIMT